MSYTPTEWKTGDVVTSAKLNKLEQGVADAGGVLVVTATVDGDTTTLDKTYAEIKAAVLAGQMPFIVVNELESNNSIVVTQISYLYESTDNQTWSVSDSSNTEYSADDPTGTLSYTSGGGGLH